MLSCLTDYQDACKRYGFCKAVHRKTYVKLLNRTVCFFTA